MTDHEPEDRGADVIPFRPPEPAFAGEVVDQEDAETVEVDPGYLGGPVDPPIEAPTLYGTITGQRHEERPPIIPAWLRSKEQRGLFARETAGLIGHRTGIHVTRSPKYAAKAAVWAPVGVGKLALRQIKWWWVLEQHGVRQHAATKNDADTWLKLHREAKKTRMWRGLVLAAEALALVVILTLAYALAPTWALLLGVAALVPVLAHLGRPLDRPIIDRVTSGPRFTRLTAEMVRASLCSIGIVGIKEPSSVTFPPPGIHRDGPGWLARVNLPAGVEAVDVMERRGRLSSALRLPIDQVWPASGPDHAGQLDLWVGYLPASRMGQPKWSLLADNARTSVFDPYEFGTDERQRPISVTLFARNFLIGGVPGSGKSYGARTLATIAMLDPTCEMKICEFKGTGDFADMAPLCSTYACGVTDREFEIGLDILRWGLAEAERRGERIRKAKERGDAPEGKVTPELAARRGSGLHPVFILIDEAHELFGDSEVGKEAAQAAERLIKRGRALNIIVVLATQIPDKTSLPPNITRCVTVRWCLAVQDQIANDMILGTGAYKRGLSATVYRPGADAGWGIAIGLERPGPVRSHFPDPAGTAAIVARATVLRGGVVGTDDLKGVPDRDVLADVLKVWSYVGRTGIHWVQLAELLATEFPASYAGATQESISAELRSKGVPSKDVKVNGVNLKGCDRRAVEDAVRHRELPGSGSGRAGLSSA